MSAGITGYSSGIHTSVGVRRCRFLVSVYEIEWSGSREYLSEYNSILRFTKQKHAPVQSRTLSSASLRCFRDAELGAASDISEGTVPFGEGVHVMNYEGTEEHIVIGKNNAKMEVSGQLATCFSLSRCLESDPHIEKHLANRFNLSQDTFWSAVRLSDTGFLAYEMAVRFGKLSVKYGNELYQDKVKVNDAIPWHKDAPHNDLNISVYHGPVLYVSDREKWLTEIDPLMNSSVSPIAPVFVKDVKGDTRNPVTYLDEREYRFCICSTGSFRDKRFVWPIGEEIKDLFRWSGSLA